MGFLQVVQSFVKERLLKLLSFLQSALECTFPAFAGSVALSLTRPYVAGFTSIAFKLPEALDLIPEALNLIMAGFKTICCIRCAWEDMTLQAFVVGCIGAEETVNLPVATVVVVGDGWWRMVQLMVAVALLGGSGSCWLPSLSVLFFVETGNFCYYHCHLCSWLLLRSILSCSVSYCCMSS